MPALCPLPPAGQQNLYFSLPAIVGWLGTAFFHAALIVVMVLLGADSLDSDSGAGHAWSLLRNGLLMFTIVIITVHLQLAIVIDQWIWLHHLAIWGSIGAPAGMAENGCVVSCMHRSQTACSCCHGSSMQHRPQAPIM